MTLNVTDLDRQLLLIAQTGDIDPVTGDPISPFSSGNSGIVMQFAERIWNVHQPRLALHPFLGPEIFGVYFKRSAVQLIIGILESRVDFSAVGTAMSVKLNQRIAARQMQAQSYLNEIIRLEKKLTAIGVPSIGLIARIEPITPPVPGELSSPLAAVGSVNSFVLDANDPGISGSPYWRRTNSPSTIR